MPTLNWIGRKAVENHHRQVPFHLLKDVPDLSVGDPGTGNLLVEGDNLLALKALLPYYGGQVKCIYIDPPYNTGNEGWIYNDNVNSPEMRAWLGRTVGGDAEDLCRHDKWLCMMYPRLCLLRNMLREDGAIFVSIDDNEIANFVLLGDEVFGSQNRVAIITWIKRVSPANDAKYFSSDHEFVIIYAKNKDIWRPCKLPRTERQIENYKNPDNDPRGPWNSVTYTCNKTADERHNLYHGIRNPNTGEIIWPRKTAVWKYDQKRHGINEAQRLLWWGIDGKSKMPRLKRFLVDMGDVVPRSFFHYDDAGHTQEARTEILDLIAECPFNTPKPVRLVRRILQIATKPGDLILDSFAGSGTTGHAVMQLNKEDGGNRRFILVEMDMNICRNVTAERLRRVCQGYTKSDGAAVEGLGGGFRFAVLGDALFDERGNIRNTVRFPDLARHVYFVETGEPLPRQARPNSPLVGVCRGTAVYLLYNGILKDKAPDGGNVLTTPVLSALPKHDGPRVIYGTACRLGPERLRREGIVFKQLPYKLRVDAP